MQASGPIRRVYVEDCCRTMRASSAGAKIPTGSSGMATHAIAATEATVVPTSRMTCACGVGVLQQRRKWVGQGGDGLLWGAEMGEFLPAVALGTGRSAVAVSASDYHTCALLVR